MNQLLLDIGDNENAGRGKARSKPLESVGVAQHAARKPGTPKIAPPHTMARALGVEDGCAGQRRNAGRWPSGAYGHGDYELGYQQGEMEANP